MTSGLGCPRETAPAIPVSPAIAAVARRFQFKSRGASGGLPQLAGCQSILCEPPLRSAEEARDHLRRYSEFVRHFPSRMGLPATQPKVQADDLFLPWAELAEQPGYVLEIHAVPLVLRIRFHV